jgi:HK97 gp10 family phage protein
MEVKCTVNLNGLGEKLQDIGPKLARKSLRKAVSKVGDYWVKDMQSRVPVDTGNLRDSINKKVSTSKRGNDISARVSVGPTYDTKDKNRDGTSQKPGVYGMFVEFGTQHSAAQPYARPCFDTTADKVVQLFADVLRDDLDSVVKS